MKKTMSEEVERWRHVEDGAVVNNITECRER